MSERPFEWKRDGGGLLLFAVGAFVSVLMVKSVLSDQPLEQQTGTAAFAWLFAGSFGALPCLVLAAGVGFLGARSFVTASESGALRHALGLIGTALGLSILLGAFSASAGGKFGLLTGGLIGLESHPMLGALFGVLVLVATAWFAWLRAPGALYEEQIRSSTQERSQVEDPGVTAAEAAGLIPEDLPQSPLLARKSPYAIPFEKPASPYPEDVRLKGQVPPGARPIANPNAALHVSSPLPLAHEQPAEDLERVQPVHPGAHVAPFASAAAAAAAPAAREVRPLAPGVRPLAPADDELSERGEDRVALDDAQAESIPERPSWERTGLGEDDEPVDAYGTPRSLIESLRKAQEDLIAIPESPAAAIEERGPVLAESEDEFGEDLLVEDEDAEGADDEDEDEDEDEAEETEEEVELFADPEEDTLVESAPQAVLAPQELESAVMAESEEFAAEVEEEEPLELVVEELVPASELGEPAAEAQALAQTTIFDFTGEDQPGVELFPEGIPEPPAVVAAVEPASAELEEETESGIELDIGEEPEVMLQPQAAPAERAHKSLSVDPERAKLLVQAGNLFVERGRVAVSMLQREYGMDFDAACKVLDELQDLGLIGPYLGGQRRDILLTRDQWLEKAGAT